MHYGSCGGVFVAATIEPFKDKIRDHTSTDQGESYSKTLSVVQELTVLT